MKIILLAYLIATVVTVIVIFPPKITAIALVTVNVVTISVLPEKQLQAVQKIVPLFAIEMAIARPENIRRPVSIVKINQEPYTYISNINI